MNDGKVTGRLRRRLAGLAAIGIAAVCVLGFAPAKGPLGGTVRRPALATKSCWKQTPLPSACGKSTRRDNFCTDVDPASGAALPAGKDAAANGSLDHVYACGPIPATKSAQGFADPPFEDSDLGFQCTELANRFLWVVWGKPPINNADAPAGSLDGGDFARAVHDTYHVPLGHDAVPGDPYLAGDIVSFSGDNGNGHVAVVIKSNYAPGDGGNYHVTLEEEDSVATKTGTERLAVTGWHLSSPAGSNIKAKNFDAFTSASLSVPATANPWGAGRKRAPDPGGGGGGTLPPSLTLPAGTTSVSVYARGTVNVGLGSSFGPGGLAGYAVQNIPAVGGTSGFKSATWDPLVGVFGSGNAPTANPPPTLVYTTSYPATVAPLLWQVFYVGTGETPSGSHETFNVPQGATQLYLGIPDCKRRNPSKSGSICRVGWFSDNGGALTVIASAQP